MGPRRCVGSRAAIESNRVSVKGIRPLSVYGSQSLQGLRGEKGGTTPVHSRCSGCAPAMMANFYRDFESSLEVYQTRGKPRLSEFRLPVSLSSVTGGASRLVFPTCRQHSLAVRAPQSPRYEIRKRAAKQRLLAGWTALANRTVARLHAGFGSTSCRKPHVSEKVSGRCRQCCVCTRYGAGHERVCG